MPTRKYLVIQRCAPREQEPPSPKQMQKIYAAFNEVWRKKDRLPGSS